MVADPIRCEDITTAILGHIQSENEVIRCAAVRALGCYGTADRRSREVLLGLLRDPDPDVRSDAIEALAPLACRQDAAVILQSLQGDPVREVKLAAIQILVGLQDQSCIPQLRALAKSKCEDAIAWEDEIADWDDWLDVQIAAIAALGSLGVTDSIDDLLAALNDEMGQTLDIPVFRALAQLGKQGLVQLLASVEGGKGLSCQRAADALAEVDPELLRAHLDQLLQAEEVGLRLLGLELLSEDMPQAEDLAVRDPSEHLRCVALRRFAGARPEWVIAALADPSATVQSTALGLLVLPVPDDLGDMLVDNMQAWLQTGDDVLSLASAKLLPKFAANRAVAVLSAFVVDPSWVIEARIAATRSLGGLCDPAVLDILQLLLADRSQQLRLVALHEIRSRALSGDRQALSYLVRAIDGTLLAEDDAVQPLDLGAAADVGMQQQEGSRNIRISEDGDILEAGEEEPDVSGSTLASLQATPLATDEPAVSRSATKKSHRVAVEGPDAVADDLSCAAMAAATGLNAVQIAAAVLDRITAPQDMMRIAVWRLLRADFTTCLETALAAPMALADTVPEVRRNAFAVLVASDQVDKFVLQAIEDSDALLRADAVGHLRGHRLLDFIADPVAGVRQAALTVALNGADADLKAQAIAQVFETGRVDTIGWGLQRSAEMRSQAQLRLADKTVSGRDHFVILDALGTSWLAGDSCRISAYEKLATA
ncbi:HEAT repeat domain-containing protein [Parasedimentitalea psychrophila]|uniref:HEAT repeat domain-containing protein n=1 Tax=Parasedimentitalea psychrophila TaxID=2997337 RepID=A0A9Y2KVX9_9RHOB|nr:HEAT repeat domain-containing protein [Parasedimentitalea psychrophila]WIY24140.1 HEAT repeat domain-containing protein [Parasedimentitalea psychrophila]